MAEGYAKIFLKNKYEVQSAGIETHGLNPNAVKVMVEDGIDISKQKSKLIDPNYLKASDLVITLCGDAKDRLSRVGFDLFEYLFKNYGTTKGSFLHK